jgi:hypothetical protein
VLSNGSKFFVTYSEFQYFSVEHKDLALNYISVD